VHDAWTGGIYFTVDRHLARNALDRDLAVHDVVLTDRSFYSTLAYQGSALPAKDRRRLDRLQRASTIVPDRMVLLDLDPDEAIRRLGKRALARGPLERRRVLRRVAAEYRTLSRGRGWIVVDARLPTAEVVRLVLERLRPLLPPPRPRPRSPAARRRR
jgi:thymidylate kinase